MTKRTRKPSKRLTAKQIEAAAFAELRETSKRLTAKQIEAAAFAELRETSSPDKKALPPRVKPNPLRTVADLRRWLRDNVPGDRYESTTPQPWTLKRLDRAILWWYAVDQATNGGWTDLRTKDIAAILLTGLPPLTLDNVQEGLDSINEENDETVALAESVEALRQGLLNHFLPATSDDEEDDE